MTDEGSPKHDDRPAVSQQGNGHPVKGINRRDFLGRGSAMAAGGVLVTGWGVSPWIGNVFHRRGEFVYPNRPATLADVKTIYSVCKQCGSDCGLVAEVVGGVLQKLDGNPYHPAATEPHARYSTSPKAAKVWAAPHSLCPKGQAGRQTLYDPYRLTVPLKRSGPRGSGQWEAISWQQLISEVVRGGELFGHVPGEKGRKVEGFGALWDHGRGRSRPLDPMNPGLGPQTNGLVIYVGSAEDGQGDFIARFASSFGTVNEEAADACCDLNRMQGTMQSLDGMADVLKPDLANAEYVIFFGLNAMTANFPMQAFGRKLANAAASGQLKYTVVDVHTGNGSLHADRVVHVKPGGDGALAMGMVSWILERSAYDRAYLEAPNQKAAEAAGMPTFTNAGWLVVSDPMDSSYGQLLTAEQAGLAKGGGSGMGGAMGEEASVATAGVVIDEASGMPMGSDKSSRAKIWPNGHLSVEPVEVGGMKCKTGLQMLWEEAHRLSLEDYAKKSGVSVATIGSLAREFTSHGRRAVADFGRGPAMHTNGFYACRAIMTLNLLIGNIDWMGGYTMGPEAADIGGEEDGAQYDLGSWPRQSDDPSGIRISRSGAAYEESMEYMQAKKAGKDPYPAKRPWFPLDGGQWPEMFAGIYEGYPYGAKIVLQHMANPAWSAPAMAGADDAELPWQRLMSDTEKAPLFIAIDTVIAESSSYADYIVPDTSYLETWEFPGLEGGIVPTKAQGIRRPVVEALTAKAPNGAPMSMEQFLIDVAKALGMPGFGANAFAEGGSLDRREDYYLKMVANIAYDGSFQAWRRGSLVSLGAVPDANAEERAEIAELRREHHRAITPAQWRKAAYVLARGGRFDNFEVAYLPSRGARNRLLELTEGLLLDTGLERWAKAPDQITPSELRASFAKAIREARPTSSAPPWMTTRYGEGGLPCQIYNPTVAAMRNAMTGERMKGTACYAPPRDMRGSLLDELDARFPLTLTTYKETISSHSYTVADPWLAELLPEAFIEICPLDAEKLGLESGDQVRVWSSTLPKERGLIGRLRVLPGVRPGVVAFPHGFGHWQYGGGTWSVDGKKLAGDSARAVPVRLNAAMRLDPSIAAKDGWSVGLMDPVTGAAAFYETRVAVEKA